MTEKQEKFCREYIKTGNASAAYRVAYNAAKMKEATVNREAKALLDNHKIAARLKELQQPAVEAAQMTLEQHLNDLKEIRDLAKGAGNFSAAATAEIARGKAAGFHIKRVDLTGNVEAPTLNVNFIKTDGTESS